jgi:hypothetical protein
MQIAWYFVGAVVPLLIGVAVSLMGLNPPEFWAARICFAFSSAMTVAMDILWFCSSPKPTIVRSAISIPIWVFAVVGCYAALTWVNSKQRSHTEESRKNKAREKLKNEIGNLLTDGGRLLSLPNAPENYQMAQDWIRNTYNVLLNGLGAGEANLFLSDSGYVFYVSPTTPRNRVALDGRLRRLTDLISRL